MYKAVITGRNWKKRMTSVEVMGSGCHDLDLVDC